MGYPKSIPELNEKETKEFERILRDFRLTEEQINFYKEAIRNHNKGKKLAESKRLDRRIKLRINKGKETILRKQLFEVLNNYLDEGTQSLCITTTNVKENIENNIIELLKILLGEENEIE